MRKLNISTKSILKYLIVFGLFFITQYKFLHDFWFVTDEVDIMLGGKAISHGFLLYGDFVSQHMPMSYYISAVFDVLGAATITLQRMYFYFFYALMWTIICYRYRNTVNEKGLMLYPFVFSGVICTYDMGTVVMSEHIAGVGFVILLLEFLEFNKNRNLKWHNCLFISISILLTFGTIFIAAFGVAAIAMGVLLLEVKWAVNEKRKVIPFVIYMIKRYVVLALWVGTPWIVLVIDYAIKDNLSAFIEMAYKVNRDIYPLYSGYGESILQTVMSIPQSVSSLIMGMCTFGALTYNSVVQFILIILVIMFIVRAFQRGGVILGGTLCVFLCASSTRGCFNFHGTQWVEAMCMMAALVIADSFYTTEEQRSKNPYKTKAIAGILFAVIVAGYMNGFGGFANWKPTEDYNETATVVATLTEEDEAIWQLDFENNVPVTADRASIENVGAVPWMWTAEGQDTLKRFGDEPPRVLLYMPNWEVWGIKMKDYAPELIEYVEEKYTPLVEGSTIYIRNDYLEEARKKAVK